MSLLVTRFSLIVPKPSPIVFRSTSQCHPVGIRATFPHGGGVMDAIMAGGGYAPSAAPATADLGLLSRLGHYL